MWGTGIRKLTLGLILALVGLPLCLAQAPESDTPLAPVSLQLIWHHQFQFAGYYAAEAQGYFREAGLDVEIRHGGYDATGQAVDPVDEVVSGRADFGVSRSDLLIHHSNGLPVVVLANIMQRSPLVFLTLERYGFTTLEEIGTRPITVTLPREGGDKRVSAETLAAFRQAGLDAQQLNNLTPTWNIDDLIAGRTQLTSAFSTDQAYFVRQRGETPIEISPRDYGVDFYGQTLFTRRGVIESHPERVAAFRKAVLKGWEYAMANPEEIATLILEHYPPRHADYDKDFLLYEAARIRELMQPELIEIGYSNVSRWSDIATIYQELELIDDLDLSTFLYVPETAPPAAAWDTAGVDGLLGNFWPTLGWIVFAVALSIASYLHLTNRRLAQEIGLRRSSETLLRQQAEQDGLTGIDNRRQFEAHFHREYQRARRHGRPLSLILFDIDRFKQINDTYGHLTGDRVLIEIAQVTRRELRAHDLFARFGGEEFVIILPDTTLDEARQVAERIWEVNRNHAICEASAFIRYTLSLGVTELASKDGSAREFLNRADTLLYQAKHEGRDRLCLEGV